MIRSEVRERPPAPGRRRTPASCGVPPAGFNPGKFYGELEASATSGAGPKKKTAPEKAPFPKKSVRTPSGACFGFHFFLAAIFVDLQRLGAAFDDLAVDHDLSDALHRGQLEH